MEFNGLSASAFADRIGVQRSSISHIISGRNKPSLDFVLKITQEFKDVDLYWLLNGKGFYPTAAKDNKDSVDKGTTKASLKSDDIEIERIVFFYTDGSFKEYKN